MHWMINLIISMDDCWMINIKAPALLDVQTSDVDTEGFQVSQILSIFDLWSLLMTLGAKSSLKFDENLYSTLDSFQSKLEPKSCSGGNIWSCRIKLKGVFCVEVSWKRVYICSGLHFSPKECWCKRIFWCFVARQPWWPCILQSPLLLASGQYHHPPGRPVAMLKEQLFDKTDKRGQ